MSKLDQLPVGVTRIMFSFLRPKLVDVELWYYSQLADDESPADADEVLMVRSSLHTAARPVCFFAEWKLLARIQAGRTIEDGFQLKVGRLRRWHRGIEDDQFGVPLTLRGFWHAQRFFGTSRIESCESFEEDEDCATRIVVRNEDHAFIPTGPFDRSSDEVILGRFFANDENYVALKQAWCRSARQDLRTQIYNYINFDSAADVEDEDGELRIAGYCILDHARVLRTQVAVDAQVSRHYDDVDRYTCLDYRDHAEALNRARAEIAP